MKSVIRFGKKGKLSPQFGGSFEIVRKMSNLAYQVALPSDLSRMHDVFHVLMLRKYIVDPDHVIEYEPLQIHEDLTYEEVLIQILDCKEQVLRIKRIPIVKVLWCNHRVEEASWEAGQDMQTRYPHLLNEAQDLRLR